MRRKGMRPGVWDSAMPGNNDGCVVCSAYRIEQGELPEQLNRFELYEQSMWKRRPLVKG